MWLTCAAARRRRVSDVNLLLSRAGLALWARRGVDDDPLRYREAAA